MRYAWLVIGLGLALAGCDKAVLSKKPLFTQGTVRLKPGLWALVPPNCATPSNTFLFDWPHCAKPARVRNGDLTVFSAAGPVKFDLVTSDELPVILQLSMNKAQAEDGGATLYSDWATGSSDAKSAAEREAAEAEPAFSYVSFVPGGAAPFKKGLVQPILCPKNDVPGIVYPPKKDHGREWQGNHRNRRAV